MVYKHTLYIPAKKNATKLKCHPYKKFQNTWSESGSGSYNISKNSHGSSQSVTLGKVKFLNFTAK